MARPIAIIGAPSTAGGPPLGVELGPSALRARGLIQRLRVEGLKVVDAGDVQVPNPTTEHEATVAAVARRLAAAVQKAQASGVLPLVIGGDHSVALGSIAASAKHVPDVGIAWIDAHPDFNTPETSPTGNLHGMVLAIVAGLGPPGLTHLFGTPPIVAPARIAIVGARSIDAGEGPNLHSAGVRFWSSHDVMLRRPPDLAKEAMEHLSASGATALHISVDLDVLDPRRWPGVSTPASVGITLDQLLGLVRAFANLAPLVGMDIVELTPPADVEGVTADAAIEVALSAFASDAGSQMSETFS